MPTLKAKKWTKEEEKELVKMRETLQAFSLPLVKEMKILNESFRNQMIQPVVQAAKGLSKAVTISPAMLSSIKQLQEQQNKLLKNLVLSFDVPRLIPDNFLSTIALNYIPTTTKHLPRTNAQYNDYYIPEIETEEAETLPTPYTYQYYPETKSFILYKHIPSAISFSVRGKKDNITILFECFYEILEEDSVVEGNYEVVLAKNSQLIQKAKEKGIKEADMNWLKSTRYNLTQKIPENLKNDVIISRYSKKDKGYFFKIKTNKKLIN